MSIRELDQWLDAVPSSSRGIRPGSSTDTIMLPSSGARAIIRSVGMPDTHTRGPAAAWAYKALDLSNAKRIFLLGPSHHYYLTDCALTRCDAYETPLGDLKIDNETVAELREKGKFGTMTQSQDEEEHSLEMHLPYIYKILSSQFSDPTEFPPLVPILVGATSATAERQYGQILAPYLADPTSVFIISSDFCHWGSRFRYTYYESAPGQARSLRPTENAPSKPAIHESIAAVDGYCMDAVESKSHGEFLEVLEETGNTVCGRHPIGVVMAAIETLSLQGGEGKFRFVRYERSNDCATPKDSSVSYCSAVAVF